MANAANFEEILSGQTGTAERPKAAPVGSYLWQIVGQPEFLKSSKKQTPFVRFNVRAMNALEDVDHDAVQEAGGMEKIKNRLDFFLTEDALYRLDEFLKDHLGMGDGVSYKEAIAMTPGRSFVGQVTHSTSEDGQNVYANITKTTAA